MMHVELVSIIFTFLFVWKHVTSNSNEEKRFCGHDRRTICCPGWYNGLNAPCSIASCAGNCGERGQCVRPNVCLCEDQRLRFACDLTEDERMQSDQAINICPENCQNRGRCESNKCVCDPGFAGEKCEVAIESACFARLQRGLCVHPIQQYTSGGNVTTKLTRELCCNTFGLAWGEPCQPCRTSYCGRGYKEHHGTCRDINECHITGVCLGGQCTNLDGSYSCKCATGYQMNEETLECAVTQDACQRHRNRCVPGGRCVTTPLGDYMCVCHWQYVASEDQKSCIPKRKTTFNFCTMYGKSICTNGLCVPRDMSYECICNEGFESSIDRKSCYHKIDVCAVHRGYLCPNGECIPLGRDFYCRCNPGFMPSFDRRRCINQCEQLGQSACPNGQCVARMNGDYKCHCFPGFVSTRDNKHCVPLDRHASALSAYDVPTIDDEYLPRFLFRRPPMHRETIEGIQLARNSNGGNDEQRDQTENPYETFTGFQAYDRKQRGKLFPCDRPEIAANCSGGFCLNLGGSSYRCECLSGYESTDNSRSCQLKTASHQEVN